MARVFNICFQHQGKSYSALVSVCGQEDSSVGVRTSQDSIQILLPTGSLSFSIEDLLQRLYAAREKGSQNATFHITNSISMQLLNTDW